MSPIPVSTCALLFFLSKGEHVLRIARVLSMPRGNALLAGVGGSGRQSVTRLAAHVCEMEIFSIEVSKSYSMTDWREDLKTVLRLAGAQGKPTVFLFTDTQIKDEVLPSPPLPPSSSPFPHPFLLS